MTTYPFALPARLGQRLPPPGRDGYSYVDVRWAGRWDGILVVDELGRCVGAFVGRRVQQHPLPFAPDDLEEVRPASRWNRLQAALPGDPQVWSLLTVLVLSPAAIMVSRFVSPWLALLPATGCAAAIRVMYGAGGFPLIRLPVALCGSAQIVLAMTMVASRVLRLLAG